MLVTEAWTVDDDMNRIGIRLSGPLLERTRTDELPSEGLVRGAMQLVPSGSIIVMLADHPVTGGYPVVAVLDDDAVDALAQARPGTDVRFRWLHTSVT
jgi:allophanate hydrolase subunit 2